MWDPELVDQYDAAVAAIGEAVGDQFDPKVIDALMYSFGPGDGFGTYWSTLHLIERFPVDETYAAVRSATLNGPTGARKWGCLLLGRRRNQADLPVLVSCLRDDSSEVIIEALQSIKALAEVGPIPEAMPHVQALLDSPTARVAEEAREVLHALDKQ